MHPDEIDVDEALVRRLLASQFPRWADLSLRRFPDAGTDSVIYRLGDALGLRFPRVHWAVGQIDKECEWLGRLAPWLDVPVPVPLERGEPGDGYPHPWLVYPWLLGSSLDHRPEAATPGLAQMAAEFVQALERAPVDGGPPAGRRGLSLVAHDRATAIGIERLACEIDAGRARSVWTEALQAGPWRGEPVWVHGDLLPGNLLVGRGRVTGVIDWAATGMGDPACDAMLAWSFPPAAREVFRRTVGFDEGTWARARGWVVEQTVHYIPYYERTLPLAVEQARRRLDAALGG